MVYQVRFYQIRGGIPIKLDEKNTWNSPDQHNSISPMDWLSGLTTHSPLC